MASVMLLHEEVTVLQLWGYSLSLVGFVAYNVVKVNSALLHGLLVMQLMLLPLVNICAQLRACRCGSSVCRSHLQKLPSIKS